jgi:aspartyl-tRNA synthetase
MVSPDSGTEALESAKTLRSEDVALFSGTVRTRLEGKNNEKLDTGEIELVADHVQILNRCKTPPVAPTS